MSRRLTPSFSPAFRDGGRHEGVNPVAVWTCISSHLESAASTWRALNFTNRCPHLVWHPRTGEVIEGVPVARAGRMFSQAINTGGAPLVQVAVVGRPEEPFTDGPLEGFEKVSKTLKGVGVPEVWPMGPPASYSPYSRVWTGVLKGGHYSVDQIDPAWIGVGAIDIGRVAYAMADTVG